MVHRLRQPAAGHGHDTAGRRYRARMVDEDEPAATLSDLIGRIELAAADAERTAGAPVDPADVARTVAEALLR